MLKENKIRQMLKAGQPVIGTMVSEVRSPGFIWMLANAGFDFVFIDTEHGTYDLSMVSDMIKVARLAGISPLVRVPDLAYNLVAQALDAGAEGIMLPRIEEREQAEKLVSYMKYPPMGTRGGTSGRGHTDYGSANARELVQHMNENTLVILQIERKRAIENLDELLSVPGVDVALMGPFDLTISLGAEKPTDAAVEDATQKVVEAGRRHKVASGTHVHDPAHALSWYERGMTMITCNSDLGFFSAGAQNTVKALREGIGTASPQKQEQKEEVASLQV